MKKTILPCLVAAFLSSCSTPTTPVASEAHVVTVTVSPVDAAVRIVNSDGLEIARAETTNMQAVLQANVHVAPRRADMRWVLVEATAEGFDDATAHVDVSTNPDVTLKLEPNARTRELRRRAEFEKLRVDYINSGKGTEKTRRAVSARQMIEGMTVEEIYLAAGDIRFESRTQSQGSTVERYSLAGKRTDFYLTFVNGRLVRWTEMSK